MKEQLECLYEEIRRKINHSAPSVENPSSSQTCNAATEIDFDTPLPIIVKCVLNGSETHEALTDSGSSLTLITEDVLNKLPIPSLARLPYNRPLPKGVTGHNIPVNTIVKLTFSVGGTTVCDHDTYVMNSPNSEIILGTDFLRKLNQFSIDFQSNAVMLNGEPLPFLGQSTEPPSSNDKIEVFALDTCSIPPRTEVILPCSRATTKDKTSDFLFEPNESYLNDIGLQAAAALIDSTTQIVPVRLLNCHTHPISIRQFATIGHLERLSSPAKVYTIDDTNHESTAPTQSVLLGTSKLKLFDFSQSELSQEEVQKIKQLLRGNFDIFAFKDSDLSKCPYVEHKINTGDQKPIKQRPYRVPIVEREKV
ncbi:MAG: retropepsin-like aspartic protease [Pseudomonadota bacterium]